MNFMPNNPQNPKLQQLKLFVSIALTILFWASAFVAIRSALDSYRPHSLALLRFLVASLVLGIYALIKRKLHRPSKKDLPFYLITGFIGITVYHVTLNIGELSVSAGTTSFIISSIPVFTAIFSYLLFREKLSLFGWIGILISFIGIAIIATAEGEPQGFNAGALFVLLAAISGCLYLIYQKQLLKKYSVIETVAYSVWIGTLFMLIFSRSLIRDMQKASLQNTLEVIYLGVFPAALAYFLWGYALSKIKTASKISTFLYLSPILTMIIAWIWMGEIPPIMAIFGGMITLGGVIMTNTFEKPKNAFYLRKKQKQSKTF
jgi:drug/metabolite transporter (DMT)-like permease